MAIVGGDERLVAAHGTAMREALEDTNQIAQWNDPPVRSITFNQSFDAARRATQLTSSWVGATQHPATLITTDPSIGYFPHGALRKATLGNGLTLTNVYNNRLQPCHIDVNQTNATLQTCNDATPAGNILDFWMTYDAGTADNGNVTHWSASSGYQRFARIYGYDQLNRISTLSQTSGSGTGCGSVYGLSWTYDAWGNRTDQYVTAGTCYAFHQSVNSRNQFIGSPYQYDAAGNMINDGSHTYTYDAENRLIKVDGGTTASYAYDPSGRRVPKTIGGTTTSYVYDLAGNPFLETQGSGWATFFLYFAGALRAQYRNGVTTFRERSSMTVWSERSRKIGHLARVAAGRRASKNDHRIVYHGVNGNGKKKTRNRWAYGLGHWPRLHEHWHRRRIYEQRSRRERGY